MDTVIAIDPGREKCGIAVVDRRKGILARAVVAADVLVVTTHDFAAKFVIKTVVIGNGTTSAEKQKQLTESFRAKEITLVSVDEYRTTDMAKIRYWQENPPRGWRRLLPTSMQVPPVPVDDYVAVILAERYLNKTVQRTV